MAFAYTLFSFKNGGLNMQHARFLAAISLAASTVPSAASAATYALTFERTYAHVNTDHGSVVPTLTDPVGSFTFDTATNQLVSFDVDPGYPPTYDFSSQVFALFAAAGPCDLQCFVGSINGSAWNSTVGPDIITTLSFAAPLSGQASAGVGLGLPIVDLENIGGTYRVANAPVPEPSTWAMMLLGFGFVGGVMRSTKRRQKLTVSYA